MSSTRGRSVGRTEHVTATGMRIIGAEAINLISQVPEHAPVVPGADNDVLYAARFQARPRIGAGSAVPDLIATLYTFVAREWIDAPHLARNRPLAWRSTRFSGLIWDVHGDTGAWTGELLWRRPHPVVSGAPCTTHVIISEHGTHVSVAIRVSADSGAAAVRGNVGAGQALPDFIVALNRFMRLTFDGSTATPRTLEEYDVAAFVSQQLLADGRTTPYAVLAPLEAGGYVIPPEELAEELLGIAQLHVFEKHQHTFKFSDTLGDRRLSCYWGALRVYMPGFSCADRPEDHPLLVSDRLVDPIMRADMIGRISRNARFRYPMPPGVDKLRAPRIPVAAPPAAPASVSARAESTIETGAPESALPIASGADAPAAADTARALPLPSAMPAEMTAQLLGLGGRIEELTESMTKLVEANTVLSDEIQRLRTTTAVRAVNTNALERRMSSLVQTLQRYLVNTASQLRIDEGDTTARGENAEDDVREEDSLSLVEVLRQAGSAHPDALLVLEAAERSALESPFEDLDRVAVILDAVAQVARRRQSGTLGASLRDAFRELGVDYRGGISAATSKKHRQQYDLPGPGGQIYTCEEHIALGESYDPRHCLRIYFTSRAAREPRFVIGHVGRHFDVLTTT
jgi:hypothetical protein